MLEIPSTRKKKIHTHGHSLLNNIHLVLLLVLNIPLVLLILLVLNIHLVLLLVLTLTWFYSWFLITLIWFYSWFLTFTWIYS